ncbi:hypothetical protein [uncultured Hyphomicrobium sp.]|jgi:hypothetical protein|uniref:hypothetical protein n=1 Tax=uncultured Hyphomicrobium sp. TaxID=194373 RepID=UPI0025E3A4B3|nr:hypothetical protein [uncultured Hyphomicrobium sp.]
MKSSPQNAFCGGYGLPQIVMIGRIANADRDGERLARIWPRMAENRPLTGGCGEISEKHVWGSKYPASTAPEQAAAAGRTSGAFGKGFSYLVLAWFDPDRAIRDRGWPPPRYGSVSRLMLMADVSTTRHTHHARVDGGKLINVVGESKA